MSAEQPLPAKSSATSGSSASARVSDEVPLAGPVVSFMQRPPDANEDETYSAGNGGVGLASATRGLFCGSGILRTYSAMKAESKARAAQTKKG